MLDSLRFDRKVEANTKYSQFNYTIYKLEKSLNKGDTLDLEFVQRSETKGFEYDDTEYGLLQNGTFFDNGVLPSLSYNRKYEIDDTEMRETYELNPKRSMALLDNPIELRRSQNGGDSDGIQLEILIGTETPQTAVTSGDLVKTWSKGDRNYFHYRTNQTIINFYSIVSADYQTKRDTYIPKGIDSIDFVDLEIYYHDRHDYNLDRMMESMKHSLHYFTSQFGPYPYKQVRIMEYPRYRNFVQSFPNVIPFSESIRYIMNINDEEDVDMVYFITAHELAHQWWGIQLEAANVQGKNLILETLAQYSAMMVLKEKYSEEKLTKFLLHQYDDYEKARRQSKEVEPSLMRVEKENHIYYAKGAIAMYELSSRIGEDKVNEALRCFFQDWKSIDIPNKGKRYATTQDLIKYFRDVTPQGLQYLITDLFEEVKEFDVDIFTQ